VICDGSEHSILECKHDGWGVTGGCGHKDDAGVRCIRAGEFLQMVPKVPKSTFRVTAETAVDSQFSFKSTFSPVEQQLLDLSISVHIPNPNLSHRNKQGRTDKDMHLAIFLGQIPGEKDQTSQFYEPYVRMNQYVRQGQTTTTRTPCPAL